MSKLPPWKAHNPRERKLMADWVIAKLDTADKAEREKQAKNFPKVIPPEHAEKYKAWRRDAEFEKQAARAGFIEPLRRRYPHLAEFLYPPKLKRGEKYQDFDFDHIDEIDLAVRDVKRIRQLWQQHYGKKNRHADDGPSAIEIAAKRSGLPQYKVEKRLKRGRR